MQKYFWTLLLPCIFIACSLPVFLLTYATTKSVIDEEFHLRQGLHFCNKRFDVWDEKITTFPGLYFVTLVLSPLQKCTILSLRAISLIAATINVILLYKIRLRELGGCNSCLAALDSFTIATLPPLYFFSHLYYTDVVSLTSVLLVYYFWQKNEHLLAAVFGASSVLMRQTNIVFVGMVFGITALDELTRNYGRACNVNPKQVKLFQVKTWLDLCSNMGLLLQCVFSIMRKGFFYLVVMLPFIVFVFLNGSIVIGDKRAHEVNLHLVQLLYFALFTLIFAISNVLQKWRRALSLLWNEKLITLFLLGVCVLLVKWNTLVHPYLLADNRHYTFYIWNRLYGRYVWFKYAITPLYVFALTLMYVALQHKRDSFKLMYWLAVLLVLCFQRLLETRYFLIPYVLLRLHTHSVGKSRWAQYLELCFNIATNAVTFYIFCTKEILWHNFDEPQRIIW